MTKNMASGHYSDSDKHSSLLIIKCDYSRKSFIALDPTMKSSQCLLFLHPGPNVVKLFYVRNFKPFQPSLMFLWVRPGEPT